MRKLVIAGVLTGVLLLGIVLLSLLSPATRDRAPEAAPPAPPLKLPPPEAPAPVPADLTVDPGQLDLSGQAGQPAAATLVAHSAGGSPVQGLSAELAGDTQGLSLENDCPTVLPPGARCSVTVRQSALSEGERLATLLMLHDGGPVRRIAVRAVGHAQPQAAPPPDPPAPAPQPAPIVVDDPHQAERARLRLERETARRSALMPGPAGAGEGWAVGASGALEPVGVTRKRVQQADPIGGSNVSSWPIDGTRLVTAHTIISASMIRALDSEKPGPATALVDRPVWSASGRRVVIPAGSKLSGRYTKMSKVGDTRLDVAWERVVTPDLVEWLLEEPVPAGDELGRIGVPADVDNRRLEKFALPMLTSLADAGVNIATASLNAGGSNNVILREAGNTTTAFGQVTSKLLDESVDLNPIGRTAAAQQITVVLQKDMRLRRVDENPDADLQQQSSGAARRPQRSQSTPTSVEPMRGPPQ